MLTLNRIGRKRRSPLSGRSFLWKWRALKTAMRSNLKPGTSVNSVADKLTRLAKSGTDFPSGRVPPQEERDLT